MLGMDRTGDTARAASEPIGYARVSTDEQNLALQLDALHQAGCTRVYKDVGSGSLKHRPELDACLDYMRAGDTLVVWRLDRLGRGLKAPDRSDRAASRPRDRVPVTHRGDRHDHQRRNAAIPHFRRPGRIRAADHPRAHPRRPSRRAHAAASAAAPALLTPEKLDAARMMRQQKRTMPEIARALGVSRATLYRHLALDVGQDEGRAGGVASGGEDTMARRTRNAECTRLLTLVRPPSETDTWAIARPLPMVPSMSSSRPASS
jgi:DNA invertase Pin-like site-specific DNA recombinase